MRKPLLKALILFSLILTVFTACDHNVYMGDITKDVWEVEGKTFYKFSDALSYYLSTLGSKAITENDVIKLIRDVPASERGEGIVIPDTFPEEGNLRVDFNGHEYWFFDNLEYFFEIRHGDTIEIINGTTIIDVPANPVPKALVVNTKTVTIDDHLIDDRRPVPKALEVQEGGIVRVVSSSSNSENALKGEVTVAGGGQLDVDGGYIEATTIEVATNSTGEKAQVNLSGGYIIAGELNINNNAVVTVTGGLLSTETVNAESTDSSNKAVFNLKGGDFDTENLNALDNSEINISEEDPSTPAYAYIQNTTIESTASFTVDDGDVTFSTTIEKDGSGTFEITGGIIRNPHDLTDEVEEAINDGQSPENVTNIVIHDYDYEHPHVAVEATCTTPGNILYYQCTTCHKYFDSDLSEIEDIDKTVSEGGTIIPALGHTLLHVEAKEETCTEDGNAEYWKCTVCEKLFSDENGTTETNLESVIINNFDGHAWGDWTIITSATCETEGQKKHVCSRCGQEETDTIEALGHLPNPVTKDDYEFNETHHWVICQRDSSHTFNYGEHDWGDIELCDDQHHQIVRCKTCKATRNVDAQDYVYKVGIFEIQLPTFIPNAPCGDMIVTNSGSVYTVTYRLHVNAERPTGVICRYYHNGKYSSALSPVSVTEDSWTYSFTVKDVLSYTIQVQSYNNGGTITMEQVVNN